MRRTTIFLPEALHEQLRREAFRSRISMAELIRKRLERKGQQKKSNKPSFNPLLAAAGIGKGWCDKDISKDIDKHVYGI